HQSSSTASTSTTSTSAAVVDPLNLRWVAAESERRARRGHSPLPGDSPEPEPPSANQQQQQQQQKFVAMYGNFRADYNRQTRGASEFNIGQMQDDRLQLLQQDWYTGRDVLDIGCNDGVFSMRIAEAMGVKSLTGLDIDEELVRTAQSNLEDRLRELEKEEEGKSPDRGGFPYNITFKAGNYVLENESDLARVEENKYDVIQAFSITKWIHLNWGDRGLKLFFKRAYRELRPDGKFIVEPQPYKSYQRTLLCPTHKQNYASNIELKPEQFKQYLEREVGFAHIVSVWEQQQCHGFQQPLLLCSKPSGRTPALAREPSQHNFRLFVPSHPL
uniref:RNA methyltransferase n=2 Tax=Macrostomum lignano TaxID=282301 RepID=A0A1I8HY77_9PLAT